MIIDLEDWDKLPTQEVLFEDVTTDTLMLSAGLGSGKTYALCRKALKLSALNKGFAGAILVPTYSDFRRDVKPEMEKILHDMGLTKKKHWNFHNTHKEYSFVWNESPLYILTGENEIAGPNLAYIMINEFSSIKYERIKEALRRVRVKDAPYKQKNLVGTPQDIYGWLEEFVELQEKMNESEPNSFRLLHADTKENTFVDDNYRRHLEGMLDEQQLKVFASGQIIPLGQNMFYYSFGLNNLDKTLKLDLQKMIYINIDFNVGNMHATIAQIINSNDKKTKEAHFVGEIVLRDHSSDTFAMINAIKTQFPSMERSIIITCDSSGKSRKTTGKTDVHVLRQAGYEVRYRSVNIRLRTRQILVNGLLYHQKIKINPKTCPVLVKDLKKVRQRKEDFTKDKKVEDLTHASDTLDYFIDFEFEIKERHTFNTHKLF